MKVRILCALSVVIGVVLVAAITAAADDETPERIGREEMMWRRAERTGGELLTRDAGAGSDATAQYTPDWWSGGPAGAAVYAIAIDPVISHTLYIATAGGGLYRSTDGGDIWDDTPNDPVDGLDLGQGDDWVDDVEACEDVVYAATWRYPDWFHRSVDGGDTWVHLSGGPLDGYANDLAVHPDITTTVYAASYGGVWTSTTAGDSWVSSCTGIDPDEEILQLAINPVTPTTIFAGSYDGRVYRTTDGGANWSDSSSGLPDQIVWSVAVNPLTPTIVYAGLEAEGVWRSDDGADSWSKWSGGDICPYVREIVVDPADPDNVYIGTDCSGVYRRAEGDTSWSQVGPFYTTGQRRVYALGMTANAPDTIFAGVWGDGMYKSTDGGESWEARNENLSAMAVNRIATDPKHPGRLYATAYGGLYHTIDGGRTWDRVRATQGPVPLYANALGLAVEEGTGRVYVGMYNGSLIASDDGVTWSDASNGLPTDCSVNDIAINQAAPSTLYAAPSWWCNEQERGVYRSVDRGANWQRTSAGLLETRVTAIAVDPNSPQTVYAGTRYGYVFRSTNGADSWAYSGTGIITGGPIRVTDIQADPQTPGLVYAAHSTGGFSEDGGVYKSTDYGQTWERVLEGHEPQALLIDPLNSQVLLAASWNDYIYRSEDGGESWTPYDSDAFTGYRYTNALASAPAGGVWRLYAGTGTNSVWQRDLYPGVFIPLVMKNH